MKQSRGRRVVSLPLALVVLGAIVAAGGCGPNERDSQRGVRVQAGEQPGGSVAQGALARGLSSEVPPSAALRARHIQSVQRDAGPAYGFEQRPGTKAAASNPAQGFTVELAEGALELRPSGVAAGWELGLRWTGIGRGGAIDPVPAGEASTLENEAIVRRPGSEEWYVNGPLGIEQGFVLSERPVGPGELVLELAVTGLEPTLLGDGSAVSLRSAAGLRVLRYTDLFATDAAGEQLDARLAVEGSVLRLAIDDAEAQYPVRIDPLVWAEQQKLVATDGAAQDDFGIAVSVYEDTAVVGAPHADVGANVDQGAVYVYTRSANAWSEQQKIVDSNDGAADDHFGYSVSIYGDTVLVGAPYDDVAHPDQGSVYVFVRTGTTWSLQQKMVDNIDGASWDHFGSSVSLYEDTAAVGAPAADISGNWDQGAAYMFARDGATWSRQNDSLGRSRIWVEPGAAYDQFGNSVSVYADTVLIGAYGEDIPNPNQGRVFVLEWNGTAWEPQSPVLVASDGAQDDFFGSAVSIHGDTALIGSWQADVQVADDNRGAAYVFQRNAGVWNQNETQKLTASDGQAGDFFGVAVSVDAYTAVIGRYLDFASTADHGAAYVFLRTGASWSQQTKLTASDTTVDDFFGLGVSVHGDTALVGARYADVGSGQDQGAAYVFWFGKEDGDPCTDASECQSNYCVDDVCCDTDCGGGDPDDCDACSTAAGASADGTCGPRSDGAVCDDGLFCNGTDACASGACNDSSGDPCPGPNGDDNCAESCNEDADDCSAPDPDGSACGQSGWECSGGSCIGPNGAACTDGSECQSGICLDDVCCGSPDCTPYACGPDGDCRTVCDSTLQCASGYVCTADRQCVPASSSPPPESDDDGGCGCRLGPRPRTPAWAGLFAFGGVVAGMARRRRRRDGTH